MEGVEKDHQRSRECPFLGRRADRGVVYSYATEANVCYAEGSAKRRHWVFKERRSYRHVSTKKQKDVCLNREAWLTCPGYLAAKEKSPGEEPS